MILDAIIGGVSSLLGGGIGAFSQNKLAKRQENFQREMLSRQQAYNDKILDRQEAWNDESSHRARIENAGYNPYLYNNPVAGTSFGTGSSSLGSPSTANFGTAFGGAIGSAADSALQFLNGFADARGKDLDNAGKEISNQVAAETSGYTDESGLSYGQAIAKKQIQDANTSESMSAIAKINENFETLKSDWMNRNASNSDGSPMLDDHGQPMSNYDATLSTEFRQKMEALESIKRTVEKQGVDIDAAKIEKEIRQKYKDKFQPEEFNQLLLNIQNLAADLHTKRAMVDVYKSQAASNYQSIEESQSRVDSASQLLPFQIDSLRVNNGLTRYNLGNAKNDYDLNKKYFDALNNPFLKYPYYGSKYVGDFLRNAFGGILGGSLTKTFK